VDGIEIAPPPSTIYHQDAKTPRRKGFRRWGDQEEMKG
jgi:hypothetical protein